MKKRLSLTIMLLLVCITPMLAQIGDATEVTQTTVIEKGVGLGSVIAVVASWSRNQSILWAILHGILSWFYVIYYAITRSSKD
ncbi:hypothetical protein [Pontibacter virosus]|uniref:Uncharacterized protein n=1 Tax=Pontibacter virosus TaxID=1765052 RepID=A0A2U1ASI5_9BACT|nr:hypothetical protein [Pontibacter virosus]PVY39404.1 hypothetical protein C8E01_11111 [Pontibacter virosus]